MFVSEITGQFGSDAPRERHEAKTLNRPSTTDQYVTKNWTELGELCLPSAELTRSTAQ